MAAARTLPEAVRRAIADSPIAVVVAFSLVPVLALAVLNGGYYPDKWYPAAAFLLALLVVALLAVPASRAAAPPVRLAAAALAAYAAWSYLSIAWATERGLAWEGANRTALYAVVFALFALWPMRGRTAAVLVGALTLGVALLGLVELLRAAAAADPSGFFREGRFAQPIDYPNGSAALWSTAFWPAVVFGARRECAPVVRALFVAAAVLLAGLALLGQSRGWLFALPIVALIFVAVTPRRVRTTLTLLLVGVAVGIAIPPVLDVYDSGGAALGDAVDTAAETILVAALVAGALAGLAALVDRRRRVSPLGARRAGAALLVAAVLLAGAGTVVYVAKRGSPFTDIADAWSQFKTKPTPHGGATRLGRLGSNRYDFWRVAWNRFESAPLGGIGADNFQEAYLQRAKSGEQPRYPHSVELRTLSQTGLIGALLLGAALVAALVAARRGIARRAGLGSAGAAAGVGAFVYWFVHGSVDWFWELPVLGMAAFALLGLAAGLAPRRPVTRPARGLRPLAAAPLAAVVAAVAGLVLLLSFALPWLSDRYVTQAKDLCCDRPALAFDKLDTASSLNPLSPEPKLWAGSIALFLGHPNEARHYFRQLLDRDSGDFYAHLMLGAIAFDGGQRAEGLRLLARAAQLNPRDDITARALARARGGRRVDVARVNRAIGSRYRRLGR